MVGLSHHSGWSTEEPWLIILIIMPLIYVRRHERPKRAVYIWFWDIVRILVAYGAADVYSNMVWVPYLTKPLIPPRPGKFGLVSGSDQGAAVAKLGPDGLPAVPLPAAYGAADSTDGDAANHARGLEVAVVQPIPGQAEGLAGTQAVSGELNARGFGHLKPPQERFSKRRESVSRKVGTRIVLARIFELMGITIAYYLYMGILGGLWRLSKSESHARRAGFVSGFYGWPVAVRALLVQTAALTISIIAVRDVMLRVYSGHVLSTVEPMVLSWIESVPPNASQKFLLRFLVPYTVYAFQVGCTDRLTKYVPKSRDVYDAVPDLESGLVNIELDNLESSQIRDPEEFPMHRFPLVDHRESRLRSVEPELTPRAQLQVVDSDDGQEADSGFTESATGSGLTEHSAQPEQVALESESTDLVAPEQGEAAELATEQHGTSDSVATEQRPSNSVAPRRAFYGMVTASLLNAAAARATVGRNQIGAPPLQLSDPQPRPATVRPESDPDLPTYDASQREHEEMLRAPTRALEQLRTIQSIKSGPSGG